MIEGKPYFPILILYQIGLSYINLITQMEASQNLNTDHIIQAFTVISTEKANSQAIKMANDFLNQCQKNLSFPSTLLSMYSQATDYKIQMFCLILLTNVIKRNWSSKPKLAEKEIAGEMKLQLKKNILEAYQLHNMCHYKHFNALIAYLTRIYYPIQYPQLHHFIINSLTQLTQIIQNDLQNILKDNRALAVLSTCKVVLKQYNSKRLSHTKQAFLQCIADIIQLGFNMSQLLVSKIKDKYQQGNIQSLRSLFQFLRKIDKVVLYALGCMPSQFQYKPQVKNIIHIMVSKIQQFNNLFSLLLSHSALDICQQIQKYFSGIIEQLNRLQSSYPLLFSDILQNYLLIILKILIENVPKHNFYQTQKVLATIICANYRPLSLFAYSATRQQYSKSIYVRKHGSRQNLPIQQQCHNIFRQVYSSQSIIELLKTIITKIMAAPHVLKDHKQFNDDFTLQDIDIVIVDTPSQSSVYQNCIDLVKAIIKCFRKQSFPVIIQMLQKVEQLKFCTDSYSQQILVNILQIIIMIPVIYEIDYFPADKICILISSVYEAGQFNYLSRIIRKYYQILPLQTLQRCFQILASVVATPVNQTITYYIIFQCAIGLKVLMRQMEPQNISLQIFASCISNMVSLVNMKQFLITPTLMWPIVNLINKFVQVIDNFNNSKIIQQVAKIIVHGLSPLIFQQRNQDLLLNALTELISMLLFCCFRPLKIYYKQRSQYINQGANLNEKIYNISRETYIVFDASVTFLERNINNKSQQNKGLIYRFWLTIMRTYPTLYEQQLYGIHLEESNEKIATLFKHYSQDLMDANRILCIELIQECFIAQLIDISPQQLAGMMANCIQESSQQNKIRVLIALASLYCSYSLIKAPLMDHLIFFVKQLIELHIKISPQNNCFRTLVFLILGHQFLNNSAGDYYNLFTKVIGSFEGWFLPYLWSMHFVGNKFAFKLNAKVLLKSISDIGASNFSQLLLSQHKNQLALDHFLKVIFIELGTLNIDSAISSYSNIFRILTKQITPQFQTTIYRKTRLHLSGHGLPKIAGIDLAPEIKIHLSQVIQLLNLSEKQLQEIIGERVLSQLKSYLS